MYNCFDSFGKFSMNFISFVYQNCGNQLYSAYLMDNLDITLESQFCEPFRKYYDFDFMGRNCCDPNQINHGIREENFNRFNEIMEI